MSETTARRKPSPSARKKDTGFVTARRKREILGLMGMALALLVGLALVTYTPADDGIVEGYELGPARNAVGRVGALLADTLVAHGVGYGALVLAGLLGVWGYGVFRHRRLAPLVVPSAMALVGTLLVATLFGWFDLAATADLAAWSGAVGARLARGFDDVAGRTGSFILLAAMLAVVLLVFVERDIQGAVDRVEDGVRRFRAWIAARAESVRLARLDAREAKATAPPKPVRAADADRPSLAARRRADDAPTGSPATGTPAPADPFAPITSTFGPDPLALRSPAGDSGVGRPAGFAGPFLDPDVEPPVPLPRLLPTDETHALPARPAPRASAPAAPAEDLVVHVQQATEEVKVDRLDPLDVPEAEIAYAAPKIDLLDETPEGTRPFDPDEIEDNKQVLLDKLETYRIKITGINAIVGPTVTLYELTPAPGIKISRITALEDDLAMAMAARGIRMIAPIPGKSAIGVEIPNRHRQMVRIRDVIGTERFKEVKMELPFPIGKSIEGETYVEDLTKMPHLLIAGATGSGKSVGLNTLVAGLLYRCHPANLKFVMIDPKKIELTPYAHLREHFIAMPENYDEPIVTDYSVALGVLKSCEKEMERRYDLLSKAQVRGIKDYNRKFASGSLPSGEGHRHLPYLVVVVDELADLMMTAGKEIEGPIARLAQMARAVGIHLVLATQRPSVDVITGLIKANFPSRIAYQVASKIDSRTILDQGGAEGLVGNGDLLYMNGSRMVRLQGPYVAMEEIERMTEFIGSQEGPGPYRLPSFDPADDEDDPGGFGDVNDRDDLFEEAARVIVRNQQGSVSLLQRKLGIGYGRAARIVDQLERAGIVGQSGGSKAREVLIQSETQLDGLFGRTPLDLD